MKKLIFILLSIFLSTTLVGQKLSIGGELGVISSINSDYKSTDFENRRNSFYSGINLNYKINEFLSFSTGIHYLPQGYKHCTCYIFEEGTKNELVGKVDYLAVPLTANISFLKSRKLLTVFGVMWSYNIKAVQDYPEPIGGCEIGYMKDISPFVQDFSLMGIVGVGYKLYQTEKLEIIPMLKYYRGFSNTYHNPYRDIDFDRKYHSALLTLMINYNL